ncbi:MAG: transcriptional regulator NrdR [Fastidiosipilaceae bacterium]|jgi:transcriptional repressor NrdR|nr:transcriptional repressor NrdR [Clostridiaceae bacterium]
MKCPYCGHDHDKVVDSRPYDDGTAIRRRRECISCGSRFTTYEKVDTIPLMVIKRGGERELFDRDKIVNGMLRACEKRPISVDVINNVAREIENHLSSGLKREVSTKEIGELVMEHLKDIDEIAYVRFASVYREFKDAQSFMDELANFLKKDAHNNEANDIDDNGQAKQPE